ncbi:hypothetical protein IAU60_000308 [Kwoniella sp. DSM 27419]
MPRDKGKGKAKVDQQSAEVAPLLGSTSPRPEYHTNPTVVDESSADAARQTLRSVRYRSFLLTVLVVLASILLAAVLFLILLVASYRPSPSELSSLPQTAFAYSPPDGVSVLNVTDDGILLNISLRCGIDADRALGVQAFTTDQEKDQAAANGERGVGAAWWESTRRWVAHRALKSLSQPSVTVNIPRALQVLSDDSSAPLLAARILDVLQVPLVWDIPVRSSVENDPPKWLRPVSFRALAKPLALTGELWEFVQRGWMRGSISVTVNIDGVQARPTEEAWWAKYAKVDKDKLSMEIAVPIPQLPHLPRPGQALNLSSLVTLQRYSFDTGRPGEDKALNIEAVATIPNFLPDLNTTIAFGLPFSIALPPTEGDEDGPDLPNKMAEVITEPVTLGGGMATKELVLRMGGIITANLSRYASHPSSHGGNGSNTSPLSLFLQNFLHGRDNAIVVSGLPSLPSFASSNVVKPPEWLLSTLPSLSLPLTFPGPKPPPKIIQSVTIDHMRISESGGKMKASGVVIAQVELPKEMQSVDIDVVAVRPDVLVFDGPAPDLDEGDGDEGENPPAKAFGHIHPEDWLASTTSPSGDPRFPHRLIVSAPINNVDLDILPGRDKVLSDFVSKVVFRGGAQAGVKGAASVKVRITGVDGKVVLDKLPVRGEFWVGKQRG